MDYANLSFPEAMEELAESVGLALPQDERRASGGGESMAPLLEIVSEADRWFRRQLRTAAGAKQAIAYLKSRGLDGKIAADFGIGFAPDAWDNLTRALGDDATRRNRLLKAGLVKARGQNTGDIKHKTAGAETKQNVEC